MKFGLKLKFVSIDVDPFPDEFPFFIHQILGVLFFECHDKFDPEHVSQNIGELTNGSLENFVRLAGPKVEESNLFLQRT